MAVITHTHTHTNTHACMQTCNKGIHVRMGINKQTQKHRKIYWTCGYQEAGDGGWGNWMKRYKLSVIQKILGMM